MQWGEWSWAAREGHGDKKEEKDGAIKTVQICLCTRKKTIMVDLQAADLAGQFLLHTMPDG